jgi:hypothetical protein
MAAASWDLGQAFDHLLDAAGRPRFVAWANRHPRLLAASLFVWPALMLATLVSVVLAMT